MLIRWELTYRCNLRCRHCLVAAGGGYHHGELSPYERLKVLNGLKDTPVRTILFIGGEPLLCPDLPNLIHRASELGIESSVATNFTLIDKEVAKQLLQAGLDAASVSFEGAEPETHDQIRGAGNFDAVIKGVEALQSARTKKPTGMSSRFRLFCDTTITRFNIHNIPAMVDLAANLNLNGLVLNRLDLMGRAEKDFELKPASFSTIEESCRRAAKRAAVRGIPVSLPVPGSLLAQWKDAFGFTSMRGLGRCSVIRYEPCQASAAVYVLRPDGTLDPCYCKSNTGSGVSDRSLRNLLAVGFLKAYKANEMETFFKIIQQRNSEKPTGRCASCSHHSTHGGQCYPMCPVGFRSYEPDHPVVHPDARCGGFEYNMNPSTDKHRVEA